MSQKNTRKLRREIKKWSNRAWREFYDAIYEQPFKVRVRVAWSIIRKGKT